MADTEDFVYESLTVLHSNSELTVMRICISELVPLISLAGCLQKSGQESA